MAEQEGAREKRILQFCHSYYGPFLDCARQYAALFDGTDYKVTTVFLTGDEDPAVAAGCHSDEVIFLGFSTRAVRGLKLGAIRALRKLASERDFSFCIAHRVKPMYVACWATDLPVFGISHSYGDYVRPGRRLFARLFRHRLHLLGVSNSVRDEIRQCMPNWPQYQLDTLYNRIDVTAVQSQQVTRDQARQALGIDSDAWVVGNVGRLHPDKDQPTLLRGFAAAIPQLPARAQLVIMGTGRLEQELKALVVTLGIGDQVVFLGQVPDGRRYFKAFDVFALSSDHEPFGMVLLEAMAAGLPLIVSDCGGAPEVVGDLGLRFPFGDEQALAAALIESVAESSSSEQWLQRLEDKFSDQAIRQVFWQMPAVKRLVD